MPNLIQRSGISIAKHWVSVVSNIFFFSGLGLATFGAHLLHPAAGYIVGGAALYWIALLMQKTPPTRG